MSIIGSPSSFELVRARRSTRCSECRTTIGVGKFCLESSAKGKVVKRVCSEDCRKTFDDHYWQGRADDRESES